MAEPSVRVSSSSGGVLAASSPAAGASLKPAGLDADLSNANMRDGPDYVDDWMEKNLAPSVIDFVRNYCTSFARWDLLRQLHADRVGTTLESLASAIGATEARTSSELVGLTSKGLVSQRRRRGCTTYQLEHDSPLGRDLDAIVRAYDKDREFRFALVYSIVRASHRGAVIE